MALKINIKVGDDFFEVEGDFTFDEGFLSIVEAWTRALGPSPQQADLDALADKSNAQSDVLDAAVKAHQPVITKTANKTPFPGE
jgi:hypothetical protein